jgi:predicted transglutaminase-like cysteine proteinase
LGLQVLLGAEVRRARETEMYRTPRILLALAALAAIGYVSSAQAAFFSYPRALKSQLDLIRFETPTLAPLAYSRFCLQFPDDCRLHRMAFRRPKPEVLTTARLEDLVAVNHGVNHAILPQADPGDVIDEHWRVSPRAGACHDYAVTKRHELLAHGWPDRALLLAEVVVPGGEHHLVLVVRTNEGDMVLDNLNAGIKSWSRTPYQWVRIQSPGNPNFWTTVAHAQPTAPDSIAQETDPSSDGVGLRLAMLSDH